MDEIIKIYSNERLLNDQSQKVNYLLYTSLIYVMFCIKKSNALDMIRNLSIKCFSVRKH